jgi:hypothetical protein
MILHSSKTFCTHKPDFDNLAQKLTDNEFSKKKVKYAYQEWPHPADTASPHSQKVVEKRA